MGVSGARTFRWVRFQRMAVCLLLIVGCRQETRDAEKAHDTEWRGNEQVVERGPIVLRLVTDKKQATIAEPVRLKISITSPSDVECEFPDLKDLPENLLVRAETAVIPRTLEDGRLQRERTFKLESYRAGRYEIPSVTVPYRPQRSSAENRSTSTQPTTATQPAHELETTSTPFTIEVVSQFDGQIDPSTFRDIKGAVEIAPPRDVLPYVAVGAVLLLILLVVLLLVRSRRKASVLPPVQLSPFEWAQRELDALLADDLLRQGRVQPFYYRLTAILREYVERQFGITAPEMTTEEFLHSLRRDVRLKPYAPTLSSFLRSCDLVKYAAVAPSQPEIDAVIESARSLIDETSAYFGTQSADDAVLEESAA